MVRRSIPTVAAILFFLVTAVAPSTAVENHTTYLPHIQVQPGKAGIAFAAHANAAERLALLNGEISWWRGWQRGSPAGPLWGIHPTQALWCDFYYSRHSGNKLIPQLPAIELPESFDGYLLFLNEPDVAFYNHPPQCAADPRRAAQLYTHVKAELPNAKLVGPGISHLDYINGFRWLEAWWKEVVTITGSPPHMDAWDIHNYIGGGDPLAPYDALEAWLSKRGVNNPQFFISEWGACDPARVHEMRQAFENDDRIVRHYIYEQTGAWWDENACIILFEERHQHLRLSPLGLAYMDLPADYYDAGIIEPD
jgi:hypothetical protein